MITSKAYRTRPNLKAPLITALLFGMIAGGILSLIPLWLTGAEMALGWKALLCFVAALLLFFLFYRANRDPVRSVRLSPDALYIRYRGRQPEVKIGLQDITALLIRYAPLVNDKATYRLISREDSYTFTEDTVPVKALQAYLRRPDTHIMLEETQLLPIGDFYLNQVTYQGADTEAPVLVFLHDSLGCAALWRDFPWKLAAAAGVNAFVYDRRGYGLSAPLGPEPRKADYMELEADILMQVLEKNGIIRPILFGHSDGGTIALLAAAKYPDRFRAVLTEGAHVFVEEETLEGILRAREQYATTNLQERLEKYHGGKTPALFEAWTATWLAPWYRDWNIEHFLPRINCPVMVIQGSEDEYGTLAQVRAITEGVAGPAEQCIVINAGHSPHKQNEYWLIGQCGNFLRRQGIL